MNETVTVGQAIEFIRNSLSDIYPRGEVDGFVKIIFRQLLNYESVDILLRKDNILPEFIPDKIAKVVKDLQKRRPIQYIFGTAYFHGHNFHVDGSTLIPRPETEELVDMIINENPDSDLSVLDCGTGSGCIAISLAIGLKFANVEAIDISEDALKVASGNAVALKAKVRFGKQDILDMPQVSEKYDIIVSNPPYIGECERSSMDSNVLDYEPNTALFVPDNDPLVFYRKIAEFGVTALKPGGRIYYEFNSRFPEEMRSMMTKLGYLDISVIRDMQGLYRFLIARKEYESEKEGR